MKKQRMELTMSQFLLLRYMFWIMDGLEKMRPGTTVKEISEALKDILTEQPKNYGEVEPIVD